MFTLDDTVSLASLDGEETFSTSRSMSLSSQPISRVHNKLTLAHNGGRSSASSNLGYSSDTETTDQSAGAGELNGNGYNPQPAVRNGYLQQPDGSHDIALRQTGSNLEEGVEVVQINETSFSERYTAQFSIGETLDEGDAENGAIEATFNEGCVDNNEEEEKEGEEFLQKDEKEGFSGSLGIYIPPGKGSFPNPIFKQ